MPVHRGDLNRALRGLTMAMLELEAVPEAATLVSVIRRLWLETKDLRDVEIAGTTLTAPESWVEMIGIARPVTECLFCSLDAA